MNPKLLYTISRHPQKSMTRRPEQTRTGAACAHLPGFLQHARATCMHVRTFCVTKTRRLMLLPPDALSTYRGLCGGRGAVPPEAPRTTQGCGAQRGSRPGGPRPMEAGGGQQSLEQKLIKPTESKRGMRQPVYRVHSVDASTLATSTAVLSAKDAARGGTHTAGHVRTKWEGGRVEHQQPAQVVLAAAGEGARRAGRTPLQPPRA